MIVIRGQDNDMDIENSKIIKFTKHAYDTASKVIPEYSSKYSRKDFNQWQHMALICVMIKTKQKWEDFPDLLANMPYVCESIGLEKIPHFTTPNKFFLRMKNKVLLVMILMSAGRFSGLASIDATGLDRRHNSKHYVKRCKITIKSMKLTLLIDTKEMKIIGIHCTATRKHDTQIILPLLKKTRQRIKELCGDKGYDSKEVRKPLKQDGTRVLVPYREFTQKQKYWNSMFDKKAYHQRSKSECVNSVIKRKYKDFLSSHEWNNQHKEAALLCVVYNIDRDVKKGLIYLIGFLRSLIFLLLRTIGFKGFK